MNERILIVDDDAEMADTVSDFLTPRGYRCDCAVGGKAALALLKRKEFDVVLTDLKMESVDGFDVLAAAQAADASRPVLIMTAYGTIDSALEAVRRGAFHYLTKPFKLDESVVWIERAVAARGLRRENEQLRKVLEERVGFRNLVGKSAVMSPLITHRRVFAGVGQHLGAVHTDRDLPDFQHLQLPRHLQHFDKQFAQQRLVLPSEGADRVVIGMGIGRDEPHRHIVVGRLFDPPRAEGAGRVAVDQQTDQHARRILRIPRAPDVDLDLAKVHRLHGIHNKMRQVIGWHPVLEVGRQ